jgi:hypothetical protein
VAVSCPAVSSLTDTAGEAGDHGGVVGTGDGDGEVGDGGEAAIAELVGEDVLHRVAGVEGLGGGARGVGVAAVGADQQGCHRCR